MIKVSHSLSLLLSTAILSSARGQEFNEFQCFGALNLEFDINDPSKYADSMTEDVSVILAQAGSYNGPDDAVEYIGFATAASPYFTSSVNLDFFNAELVDFNSTSGVCTFRSVTFTEYTTDPDLTTGHNVTTAILGRSSYSIPANKVSSIHVYYTPAFLEFFLATLLNTDKTRNFVCSVLNSDGCSQVSEANGSPSQEACVEELKKLPIAQSDLIYFDGNSQGCRFLHSVFAFTNTVHCPHISFVPVEDDKGREKCQVSSFFDPTSVFTEDDLQFMQSACTDQEAIDFSEDCFLAVAPPAMEEEPTVAPLEATATIVPTVEATTAVPTVEATTAVPTQADTSGSPSLFVQVLVMMNAVVAMMVALI